MEEDTRFFNKGAWKAVVFAVILLVAGELLLAWQYNRLAKGRVSELEQRIEEQQRTIEEQAAQETLKDFLDARIARDEVKALRYVTEEAMQQRQQALFDLFGIQDYEVKQVERFDDTNFRFQVSIAREDRTERVEIIDLTKILGDYYIDSVQLAG